MSNEIRNLEPKALWSKFADLNAVPRPSKKEERVIAFMVDFGNSLGLETTEDEVGNVIIRKPATPGMEDRKTIVMQAHLDMVHQKNAGTDFDFDEQGIDMYVDGDWVRARGTTLGADNGLGVAAIMAFLESKDLAHPALEALFTIDEETGMTGAELLKPGLLEAEIMLNLDTEDDDELTIGCAGGIDISISGNYTPEAAPAGSKAVKLYVKGLKGGHSGMDIYLGLANANKVMNRILWNAADQFDLRIASVDGGGLRNAIPRESVAEIVLPEAQVEGFNSFVAEQAEVIYSEFTVTDPEARIFTEDMDVPAQVIQADFQQRLLASIYACPNGIYRMSPEIEHLVQTSNNLARVLVKDGSISIYCLTRSAKDTEKFDLAASIKAAFQLMGADVEFAGSYPGWTPNPGSQSVALLRDIYIELFNEDPHVAACHAGLECGILGKHYPQIDMVSFGPTIKGAHSPEERASISSSQKFWNYLCTILERIPARG